VKEAILLAACVTPPAVLLVGYKRGLSVRTVIKFGHALVALGDSIAYWRVRYDQINRERFDL